MIRTCLGLPRLLSFVSHCFDDSSTDRLAEEECLGDRGYANYTLPMIILVFIHFRLSTVEQYFSRVIQSHPPSYLLPSLSVKFNTLCLIPEQQPLLSPPPFGVHFFPSYLLNSVSFFSVKSHCYGIWQESFGWVLHAVPGHKDDQEDSSKKLCKFCSIFYTQVNNVALHKYLMSHYTST